MEQLGWAIGAAALASTTAGAASLTDARSLVDRLGNPGDYGRNAAGVGLREARAAAEGWWPNLEPQFRRRASEAQAALAEARRLWASPMGVPLPQPNWQDLDGRLAALNTALNSVTAARATYITAANARANDAVNATVNDLRGHAEGAVRALRGLLPGPAGTRPATRKGKCRVPGTNLETDCMVPNEPPGDNDIRTAVEAGNAVVTGLAKAAAVARINFEKRMQTEVSSMFQKFNQAQATLSHVMKAIHEAQITAIKNLK